MATYYDTLEVPIQATSVQIKQAYRQLAKRHHPDVNGGSREAEQRFKAIQEAYDTLGDPDKRSAYDEKLTAGASRGTASQSKRPGSYSSSGAGTGHTSSNIDMNRMSEQFEQFFGVRPKDKQAENGKSSGKKNPLDTTDIFNRFFGK
ncbi:MAG: DnaJ domain-containing protein [Candidatus Pristimantibacillus sp.]